ncbi:MAG TPA: transposase [Capsulimonadaceae bacterium]|jgi:REP element-mobilizing transposase RayT
MDDSHIELFVHIVWTTADRLPTITDDIKPLVYSTVAHEITKRGVCVLAIGGIEDHVHVLVRAYSSVDLPDLLMRAKGVAGRVANASLNGPKIRWQRGYGAFSISRWDVPHVTRYITNQRKHHAEKTTKRILELG